MYQFGTDIDFSISPQNNQKIILSVRVQYRFGDLGPLIGYVLVRISLALASGTGLLVLWFHEILSVVWYFYVYV